MTDSRNYDVLDRPEVVGRLFHPRSQVPGRPLSPDREDFMIPVAREVSLGASLYKSRPDAPVLIFFHGNGEIVSDYDDLGPVLAREAGVNFFVADYRGYGDSTGRPGVRTMLADAYRVLDFCDDLINTRGWNGTVSVMGRSLGSAPAIELAAKSDRDMASLIVESGFAFAAPLLRVLGLEPGALGFTEEQGFENLDKIKTVGIPSLIIHAQLDTIIPFSDGERLFQACPATNKHLLEIKGATHNDIFLRGMAPYLDQVRRFTVGLTGQAGR